MLYLFQSQQPAYVLASEFPFSFVASLKISVAFVEYELRPYSCLVGAR